MALTYPRDMVTDRCWATAAFMLNRRQEMSRTPAGVVAKDLGPSLWRADFETYVLPLSDAEGLHANFLTLGGALRTFYAAPMQKRRPAAWSGEALTGVTINAIRSDNAALRLTGLPAGFVLTAGDYVSIETAIGGRELIKLATGGTVSGTGLSPWVEVVPHLRPSVAVGDAATLIDPLVEMRLDPGSLEMPRHSLRRWKVSFSAMQVVR